MMLSENPDVEEFSEWVDAQSSEFSEPGEHFSKLETSISENFSDEDLIQKLFSIEPKEDFKEDPSEPELLQQLFLLKGHHGHDGDTKGGFSETDLVQELMVLEQEGQQDVELFQDLHAIDHMGQDNVKDEINTTEDEADDGEEEEEKDKESREISTTIYKSRLEEVGLGGLDPMYVISCTTNEFRDLTLSGRMLPGQIAACKEVRKKGRNKQHATKCRSRKESEVKVLKAKVEKAKKKKKQTELLQNQLMTEMGLLEWKLEETKFRCQNMVPWKIDWSQILAPFPSEAF